MYTEIDAIVTIRTESSADESAQAWIQNEVVPKYLSDDESESVYSIDFLDGGDVPHLVRMFMVVVLRHGDAKLFRFVSK